jgi:4-amino-4-deoxy-L-arabinose transferase-like glycosyltransferase
MPGYPLLIATLFIIADDPPEMRGRLISILSGTATVGVVMWLTGVLFDQSSAFVAGAMMALYPGAVAMSVLVLAEAPFSLLMTLQLAVWSLDGRWPLRSMRACGLLGGLLAGAATLMRPSWLLFTPLAIAVALLLPSERGRLSKQVPYLLAGLLLLIGPWWVRNYRVTGRWVPTTLQVGASLYDGWHPQANGASDMEFVDEFRREQRVAEATTPTPLDSTFEYRLDRRMRAAAVAWASENPGRALELALIKLGRMWNIWPNEPTLRSWPIRLAVAATYLPLLALGLVGAIKFCGRGWTVMICLLPAVYFSLLHMIFVSSIRYREPAMMTVIVLAAATIATRNAKGPKVNGLGDRGSSD